MQLILAAKEDKRTKAGETSKWAVMSWLIFIYFKKDLSWILELKCFKSAVRLWHGLWCGIHVVGRLWYRGGKSSYMTVGLLRPPPPTLLGAGVPCDRRAVAKKAKLTANGTLLQECQTLGK